MSTVRLTLYFHQSLVLKISILVLTVLTDTEDINIFDIISLFNTFLYIQLNGERLILLIGVISDRIKTCQCLCKFIMT